MHNNSFYKSILVFLGCFLFAYQLYCQNLDVNLVRKINPENPNSFVWKGVNASAYPLSVGVPIGLFIAGAIAENKETKVNAAEITASVLSAAVSAQVLKMVINRARPFEKYKEIYPYHYKEGKSLPSGHVSLAFASATSASIIYKKWYFVVPAYVWASSVAYSRLYLGEHYPTDVLAGAALGAGSAWLTHKAKKWWFNRSKKITTNIN